MKHLKKCGALMLAVSLMITALVGCKEEVGIIGGADGPTAIYVADSYADIYKTKTPYVGNASAVGSVIKALINDERYKWQGMELQTTKEPYGLTIKYILLDKESKAVVPADPFEMSAPLFFALIDNLDTLTIYIEGFYDTASKTYTREEFDVAYYKPIAEYAETEDSFAELYKLCFSPRTIDTAISDAIISSNSSRYLSGEFRAEAHIILGSEKLADGTAQYYCITRYSEFGFENGVFTVVAGSGNIPARITLDGDLNLVDYKWPDEGSYYEPSVKEMFPAELVSRAVTESDDDREYCDNIIKEKAKAYLKQIGREAEVLDYGDFEHPLLTDKGVSVEVSNKLISNKDISKYPYWIGNLELVENGVRYLYSLEYEYPNIIYTKTEYDTGKTVESFTFDSRNGEQTS